MSGGAFLNTSHQTIGWFADQSHLEKLELRPPFQRRPVWTDEEKSFLVDSILRSYPVPEVYVQTSTALGDAVAVVDGQQRLRACLEFLADGFAVSFDLNKLQPLYTLADTPWYGKRYSQLSSTERDRFRRYKLIVRDLEGLDEQQVRHIFHRLNQSNVSLNAQELRYSIYANGMLAIAEKLVEREEWEQFRIFTKMQRRRMLDTEYVSELIIGSLHWPQNKKESLDAYYRQYADNFPFADEVLSRFEVVLGFLVELFPKPKMGGTRWYRKSDFYTLFLAIARGKILLPRTLGEFDALRDKLTEFSIRVGAAQTSNEPGSVTAYRDAVGRAATDRSRRVRREEALVAFLNDLPYEETATDEEPADMTDDDVDDEEYEDRPA
ncbi:MAG: DUF262 domain-containing protein [Frankiaceae bacterium]